MTSIEWTDETWNPVTGCDRVSPGCAHCYALDLAARLKAMGQPRYQRDGDPRTSGPGFGVTLHEDKLEEPLHWRRPRMVFVNSMSDLFHEAVPDRFIADVFAVMEQAEQHTFQILTKRPERLFDFFSYAEHWAFLPNVWMGTSIENRRFLGRADALRSGYSGIKFISAEPLLGPLVVDRRAPPPGWPSSELVARCAPNKPLKIFAPGEGVPVWNDDYAGPELDLAGIDWLIAGGESGPRARPMRVEWVLQAVGRPDAEGRRPAARRAADFEVDFGTRRGSARTPQGPAAHRVRQRRAICEPDLQALSGRVGLRIRAARMQQPRLLGRRWRHAGGGSPDGPGASECARGRDRMTRVETRRDR